MRRSTFDEDTAVRPLAEGAYAATISPRWNVGTRPNGGYLLSVAARALAEVLGKPDPFTVTGHFLAPPSNGPATIGVDRVRSGRNLATGVGALHQEGAERLRVLGTFGDLGALSGPTAISGSPPSLPAPEHCRALTVRLPGGVPVAIAERFETRFAPQTLGWAGAGPNGRAEVGGWIRFADGREPDPLALLTIVDALPPAVFELGFAGWTPTIELTVHARARPAPGWLACWFRTRFLSEGYLEEDGEVWDSAGCLVAQSRQLARLAPQSSRAGPA